MEVPNLKTRDSEYPYLSYVLRSIISAACAIQVISVIYIYQKSFEMSIEMSSKTKSKRWLIDWFREHLLGLWLEPVLLDDMGNSNIPNPSTAWSQRELQHPHRQGRDSVQFKHDYNMLIYDKTSDCLPHNIPLLKMGQDVLNIEWHIWVSQL